MTPELRHADRLWSEDGVSHLADAPRQLVNLTSCGWFRAFPISLHFALDRARKCVPPGRQTSDQGLMKEFQAGNLRFACHEKSFSHLRNAPKATNRPFSPDSGGMIGLRAHFAFR